MLDIKTFREAKELQEDGVMASVIMKRLNISKAQYYKWCLLTEETYLRHIKNKKSESIENYREFIISILKITPQINDTTILCRCIEEFDDFNIPRITFLRKIKQIREESGYVKDMGFTVNFCHKHDSQSKGKVENTVWSIKHQFLDGRIYTGVDALNEECLKWLDRFGNGDYHLTTKKIPRDMFKNEYSKLIKVKIEKRDNTCILTVKQKRKYY